MPSRLRFHFEFYPNYVAHLLACSGVVFSGPYGKRYREFVDETDRTWIAANRDLLEWGNGKNSPLTLMVVFIPGYLNPHADDQIKEYFAALRRCIERQSLEFLIEQYPALKNLADWVQGPIAEPFKLRQITDNAASVERLESIFESNLDSYKKNVLPEIQPRIAMAATAVERQVGEADLIGAWERLTGVRFEYTEYTFVLSDAMEDGPNFNSLGYEKNWVYFKHEDLVGGVIHEIGTHLLIDIAKDSSSRYDSRRAYNTYETMCHFYASRIAEESGLFNDQFTRSKVYDQKVMARMESLQREHPDIRATEAFDTCMSSEL